MINIDEATKKYEPKKENDNNSNANGDADNDNTINNTSGGAKGSSVYTPQYD